MKEHLLKVYSHVTRDNILLPLLLKKRCIAAIAKMITSVALCSLYFLLFVPNCQGILRYCSDQGKNYTECALMYWTGWKECTGGHGMQASECQIGFEKRQKAVCCPRNSTNETTDETFLACKINCNMTDDDFEELRVLTTTGTEIFLNECYTFPTS